MLKRPNEDDLSIPNMEYGRDKKQKNCTKANTADVPAEFELAK